MSEADFAVAALVLACFYSLWWCLSLSRRLRQLERTSRLDRPTGLGSGDWLHAERWPAALRSGRPLGVVYLDLDHLKLRNDRFSHAAGDVYIRAAAEELSRALRRGVDEVFRLHTAGDEFLALLHGPILDLASFGRSLLGRLRRRGVAASIGLAYCAQTEHLPERVNLRNLAEAACRQAKRRGGDCVVIGFELDVSGDVASGLVVGDGERAPMPLGNAARGSATSTAVPEPIEREQTLLDGLAQPERHAQEAATGPRRSVCSGSVGAAVG